jgi:nucleoside 2-deoxyribosyltransferase
MYKPKDLASLYNVSQKTIYSKLKNEKVKQFVINTNEGLRLKDEGFNHFQILMSNSRVGDKVKIESTKVNDSVKDEYIDNLKDQIKFLKEDRQLLVEEKKQLLDQLGIQNLMLKESQEKILLLETKETKEQKKSFLQRLFNK